MRQLNYIPSFHGLRAIACLAVFGVHLQQITGLDTKAGPFDVGLLLQNGNTGVCLFFMLSGFLLSLPFWMRDPDSASERFQPLRYAAKRIGRIVPAYYICLTALVVLGKANGTLDIALHYMFLHNLTDGTLYSMNDPFWTLAVQAQFYVLFPFVLLLMRPFLRAKAVAFAGIAVACAGSYFAHASLLDWAATTNHWPIDAKVLSPDGPAMHVSTLAHLPHFFMGMLAAAVYTLISPKPSKNEGNSAPRRGVLHEVLFWLCAAALLSLLAIPSLDAAWRLPSVSVDANGGVNDTNMVGRYNFPFGPALVAVMLITGPGTLIARKILESPPLKSLGIISYGVYVYHLPCLGVAKKLLGEDAANAQPHWFTLALVGLAISMAVAAASYIFIERPLIHWTRKRSSD